MRDEQLYAFVADARARGAAELRRRTRWLHRQLREDATFVDLCRDLAASGVAVEVSLADGRRHRGHIAGAGTDVLAVVAADDTAVYIAAAAIIGVRAVAASSAPTRSAPASSGAPDDQRPPNADHGAALASAAAIREDQCFSDVLGDLADLRARAVAGTVAQQIVSGVIAGVGRDVVWFDDNQWYLRLAAITDVMIVP